MNISCPIPQLETDVITMGHGSGGLLTHRLLSKMVFEVLQDDILNQQHDGAILTMQGPLAFSTDSFVVSPIFFPGGDIGDLAVNGTVNDLAMCGAKPQYLSLSFIIEEGLPTADLGRIIMSIKDAADRAGVNIVTGDTKVVEKGKGDKIFINTSGVGCLLPGANIHHNRLEHGDRLIISGQVATHGIAIMSVRQGLEFETTIESDTMNLNHTIGKLIKEYGSSIKFLRDPTRGGVASVLNELAELTQLGIAIDEEAIPLDEQVEGACEMLGLDPLYVANEGIFIAVVDAANAEDILATIRQDDNGRQAAIIGQVTQEHPGKVIMKSSIGGRRVVNYLTGEQLPRIC